MCGGIDAEKGVLIMNAKTNGLRKLFDIPFQFQSLGGNSQAFIERPGSIVAFVYAQDKGNSVIRVDWKKIRVEVIGDRLEER